MPGHQPLLASSQDGALAFVHQRFPASAGAMGHPTQLRLALVLSGSGRLEQYGAFGARLASLWSVGQFNVVLPGQTGTYSSPAVEILGLAIDYAALHEQIDIRALAPLASRLHRDATVSAVLHAFQSAAETKVLSDPFLWAGTWTILRRLQQLARQPARLARTHRPLTSAQLQALMVYVDGSKDTRPSVQCMAEALGLDRTRFQRGMQAATGMSPHDFLTQRRMHWAVTELERGASVMHVAQTAGYANASKFAAAFRRVIGRAPSEVRRHP